MLGSDGWKAARGDLALKKRDSATVRQAAPVRVLPQRFMFLTLIGITFGLLVLGKADGVLAERMRVAASDLVTPILEVMSRPISSIREAVERVRALGDLQAENQALRAQNQRLLEWQAVARQLDAENRTLRDLMKMAPDPRRNYVTSRVVTDYGGAFARSVLINAGERDGIAKNQAAVTGAGLAGRIVEVGEASARVLLITDINSRIPVMIEGSRDRAVLAGTNGRMTALLYLPRHARPKLGQRIVTSGHGGLFPPGIPVGRIATMEEDQIAVQPLVDWDHLELLRVVDYQVDRSLQPRGFEAIAHAILAGKSGVPGITAKPSRRER
jgi:rod shape-determining protein MreC